MEIHNKLIKPISEVKYLAAENAWRYRSILRFLYLQYETIKYWMYKEEVFEELKKHSLFEGYTMEQCKQDLDTLVEWGNLLAMQDTSKVSTVEEFKNKQFRYQLSEYSVEIERMMLKLENMSVEGASLEPSLLDRIKQALDRFHSMEQEEVKAVGNWWSDLNSDFKRLNQNYQDYIRELHSIKAEEMMKTQEFMIFKDRFIDYLRDFIKGLQNHSHSIEAVLREILGKEPSKVLTKVWEYELSIPRIELVVSDQEIWENIEGRWKNICNWFLGSGMKESEASKLFDITNEIIRKITRFASQIAETKNSAANRKEEYKRICELFLQCEDIEEAHKLSAVTFGIFHTKHVQGNFIRKTESINSGVFEEEPFAVKIKPRIRTYKEKAERTAIASQQEKKQRMLQQILKTREEERNIMEGYIQNQCIDFATLPVLPAYVRGTLLRWLTKAMATQSKQGKTEDGKVYKVLQEDPTQRCTLRCEDGMFEMPAYVLVFEPEGK